MEKYKTRTQNDELFERSNSKAFVGSYYKSKGTICEIEWQSEKGNLRKSYQFIKKYILSSAV